MPRPLPPTTVTQLTPDGRGAVATLSVSGPESLELVGQFFVAASGKSSRQQGMNAISFGRWSQPNGITEDVVVVRRSDDDIEISCHGGLAAASAIIGSLESLGAKRIDSTPWIAARTYGPLEADAWIALSRAKTERVAGILLDQLRGALRRAIGKVLSLVQAGDLDTAHSHLDQLIRHGSVGLHLTTPWRVAIVGEPNVGKSSLVNRLVGFDRSIVFDRPGTTRDVLTASTAFDGWPVDLLDTAGLRDSEDDIEQEGVRRAQKARGSADLAILVLDAQLGPAQLASEHARNIPNAIIVANKQDLASGNDWPEHVVRTSAMTGEGIASLIVAIMDRLVPEPPRADDPVPWTKPQLTVLRLAFSAVEDVDLVRCQRCLQDLVASARDVSSLPSELT